MPSLLQSDAIRDEKALPETGAASASRLFLVGKFWTLRTTIWCSFLSVGVAVILIGLTVWTLRGDAIRDAAGDSKNIASVLVAQTAQSIESIEMVLNDVLRRIEQSEIESAEAFKTSLSDPRTFEFLKLLKSKLKQAEVIAIADSDGLVVNTSRQWPTPDINLADRDHFKYLSQVNDANVYVSATALSRATDKPIIFFSKRLTSPEGLFLGVVFVGLDPAYFANVYQSIRSLRHQSFELVREDGAILVRYPEGIAVGSTLPRSSQWYWNALQGGGDYIEDERFVSIARVAYLPLFVNVSASENYVLQNWRWRTILISIGTLIAISCPIGLLILLKRQFQTLLGSEERLERTVQQLGVLNARLDLAFNNMSQGLCFFDGQQRLIVCNRRFFEMYNLPGDAVRPGLTLEQMVALRFKAGTSPKAMSHRDYLSWRENVSASNLASDTEVELADGRFFKICHRPMPDGGWVATHEDISNVKRDELRISHMAHHDELTNLANRTFFRSRLEQERTQLGPGGFAILLLDLDRFKAINDSMGHSAGDQLLQEVACRLIAAVSTRDIVARLGGDEFAVLLTPVSDQIGGDLSDLAESLAHAVIATVNDPFYINGVAVVIGMSIGIALAPEHGSEPAALLKRADLALYRSKSKGQNVISIFHQNMQDESDDLHKLEMDMRTGICNSEFELHYQPILDAHNRRVVGAEALVRWRHPEYGLMSPARFIPIAETSGLILPLGKLILTQACRDAATWPTELTVSVNLSAVQFKDADLFDSIVEALASANLPPKRLEVEVTESVLLEDNIDYAVLLHRLKNLGVSVALDDFGTGYSSLSYLKQFPFDRIKIDRSFIKDITENNDSMAIVSAVVCLARGLDMITTAEGIETERQYAIMRAAGVTSMQGFLFGEPSVSSAFLNTFEDHQQRNQIRS